MSNGPEVEALASPPISEPWVPLWPLSPNALGELAYAQITSIVPITATGEAGAQVVVTAPAVTVDGNTPIVVEFAAVGMSAETLYAYLTLFDNGVSVGQIAFTGAVNVTVPVSGQRRLVPSAGSHTYSVRGAVNSGTGQVIAGPGGPGEYGPASLRVSLAAPVVPASGTVPVANLPTDVLAEGARMRRNANPQTIAHGAFTKVTYDTLDWEMIMSGQATPADLSNNRIVARVAGVYLAVGCCSFAGSAVGNRVIAISVNGSYPMGYDARANMGSAAPCFTVSAIHRLGVGDWFEMQAYQDSGAPLALDINGYAAPALQMVRLGP